MSPRAKAVAVDRSWARSRLALRPGPSGDSREQVAEIQRDRMLAAAVEAVQEVGYARMSVAEVISRARVSRKTFYDIFTNRDACFEAAFDDAIAEAAERARRGYEAESSWREGIRSGLLRLLEFIDHEPTLARLWVVEALGGGERLLRRRAQLMEQLATVVDQARDLAGSARQPPAVTAEGVVGGVLGVLHARLLEEDREPVVQLLNPFMSMIVLPYLGVRAATRELDRPAPPMTEAPKAPPRRRDPLDGLNMRLTYRTVRVLTAVSKQPGASNREIAEAAGIVDQGQVSKLLSRLEGHGVLENRGEGQPAGASNAWSLTHRGAQLEYATRPRFTA